MGEGVADEILDAENGGGDEGVGRCVLDRFAPVDKLIVEVNLSIVPVRTKHDSTKRKQERYSAPP